MKTIGVIGGLGPQATMDFERRVHEVAQRLIPPRYNGGYPPMVVYYHRYPPMLKDEHGQDVQPLQLDPRLKNVLEKLGTMADFLVITSNFPHLFRETIEETSGCKVLSMIDTTVGEVQRRGLQSVGVLGLGEPVVYNRPLDGLGIRHEILQGEPEGLRERLDAAILSLMEGRAGAEDRSIAWEAVETLRGRGVEAVILGCTEIPLLLGNADAPDFINPLQLLAQAAVEFAIE